MDNLRIHLAVEITTGDRITPREIEYSYNSIFENKKILIFAYTLETVIAEKFQTIISRGIFNTRMKDFYDIYVLSSKNINKDNLKVAIKNTFEYRNTNMDVSEMKEIIGNIKDDVKMQNLWKNYQKNAPYANKVQFLDLFDSLYFLISIL